MATRSQKVKLGIFVVGFTLLFAGTLIVFAGMKIWEDKDHYTIYFTESVSGLEVGAPVKLRGVAVGTVNSLQVDPESVERVKVEVELNPGSPIKVDSRATLQFQGITGLKFVEISEGTIEAQPLPEGSVIAEGESAFTQIAAHAEGLAVKADLLFDNLLDITRDENRQKVDRILSNTDEAIASFNQLSKSVVALTDSILSLIDDNRDMIRQTLISLEGTSTRAESTMAGVEALVGDVRTTVNSMNLGEAVANLNETNLMIQDQLRDVDLSGTLQRVTVTLAALQIALQQLTQVVGQNQDQLRSTMYNLRTATESLKEFGRKVEEQPSRLLFDSAPSERRLP